MIKIKIMLNFYRKNFYDGKMLKFDKVVHLPFLTFVPPYLMQGLDTIATAWILKKKFTKSAFSVHGIKANLKFER